jgi:hypothetical protein
MPNHPKLRITSSNLVALANNARAIKRITNGCAIEFLGPLNPLSRVIHIIHLF